MLISHSRVKKIAWGISTNGSGVAFATSPASLTDGRPGSLTRFLWPGSGAPSGVWVQIEGTWTSPAVALFFGMLNLSVLQGSLVEVSFRRAFTGTWDTPVDPVYVEQLSSGARVAYSQLPDVGYTYTGVRIKLFAMHPIFGGPALIAGNPVDIGEIWLGVAQDVPILSDWSVADEDPTISRDSELLQPYVRRGTPRRVLTFTPSMRSLDGIYGPRLGIGTSADEAALEAIKCKLDRGQQVVCVPRHEPGDNALMARSAIFGTASKLGGFRHLRGGWYGPGQYTIKEAPIPVPMS